MTTIEKIKAEIERLKKAAHLNKLEYSKLGNFVLVDSYSGGEAMACEILSFLSTLESEKPMNFDFNYEFSHFLDKKDEELGSTTWSEEDLQELARHFYELGCRRTAEKYDEIEYNRQRAEEQNGEELEKEIYDYCPDSFEGFNFDNAVDLARHFAEWGAEHLKK